MRKKITGALPNRDASPARSSLQNALRTPLGRKLPTMMRRISVRFANGGSLEDIAGAEGMTVIKVEEVLRYAARHLGCKALPLGMTKAEEPTGKRGPDGMGELRPAQFMTAEKCERCGKVVEADSERVLVAPMALMYGMDDEYWGCHRIIPCVSYRIPHYCLDCAVMTEEFRMPNPWFVSDESRRQMARFDEECRAQEELERTDRDKYLTKQLAAGDLRAFNSAFPTSPGRSDVMARAVPVSRVAEKIAGGTDEPSSTSEIADTILSGCAVGKSLPDDEGWAKVAAAQSVAFGDAVQRAKVLEYLNSPQSRGRMLPRERETARMWAAGGLSENEIARRQNVNQSTVHRRIDAVRKKAHAAR